MNLCERHGLTNYKLFSRLFQGSYGCTPADPQADLIFRKMLLSPLADFLFMNTQDRLPQQSGHDTSHAVLPPKEVSVHWISE